jgi:hypothetical protein
MSMPGLAAEASLSQADGRRQLIGMFVARADGGRIVPQPWGSPSTSSGPAVWSCTGCSLVCHHGWLPQVCVWHCARCQ